MVRWFCRRSGGFVDGKVVLHTVRWFYRWSGVSVYRQGVFPVVLQMVREFCRRSCGSAGG